MKLELKSISLLDIKFLYEIRFLIQLIYLK